MPYFPKPPEDAIDVTLPADPPPGVVPAPFLRDLAARYTPSFYLDLGNVCNLACRYCCLERDQQYFATTRDVLETARRAAAHGLRKVALIGGEPTIRKDLREVVGSLRAMGYDEIVLTTNGLVLAWPEYVDDLAARGVTTVHLSLDDFEAPTQAALAQNERAPDLVLRAFENLMARPQVRLYLYAVLTGLNLPHVGDYLRRVHEAAARHGHTPAVVLAGVKPQARALEHRDTIVPPADLAAATVREAVALGDELGVPVAFKNLPPCLLPDLEARSLDACLVERRLDLATGQRLPALRNAWYVQGPECPRCARVGTCEGVHRNYVQEAGWGEFHPLEGRDA